MTLITEWVERQEKQLPHDICYIICTLDRPLSDISRTIISSNIIEAERSAIIRERFDKEWGEKAAARIWNEYQHLSSTIDTDVNRPANQKKSIEFWMAKIAELESELKHSFL